MVWFIDEYKVFLVNVFEAFKIINDSWKQVTDVTIKNFLKDSELAIDTSSQIVDHEIQLQGMDIVSMIQNEFEMFEKLLVNQIDVLANLQYFEHIIIGGVDDNVDEKEQLNTKNETNDFKVTEIKHETALEEIKTLKKYYFLRKMKIKHMNTYKIEIEFKR